MVNMGKIISIFILAWHPLVWLDNLSFFVIKFNGHNDFIGNVLRKFLKTLCEKRVYEYK